MTPPRPARRRSAEGQKLVAALNEALSQEYACFVRYKTHAAVLQGVQGVLVAKQLDEIAEDEEQHAATLRERIVALGGVPTQDVAKAHLRAARTVEEALRVNIQEEKGAIALYAQIFRGLDHGNILLYESIEHILEDEQEHLEELERLQG